MHHEVRPNLLRHSPKRTKTVVFAKEDPDNKGKLKILLPLASTLPLSGKIRSKIKIGRTSPTLSATLISRKAIMQTSAPKRGQKTRVGLDNFHVGD